MAEQVPPILNPHGKVAEVRVNKLAANIVCSLLSVLLCAAGVLIARRLPHYAPPAAWHLFALLVTLLVLVPVHEALHAVGLLRFAKVSKAQIRFGVLWRALIPYCHCTVPISVQAYRRMALLPLWVTGVATVVPLLICPSDWLGLLAGIALASCVGDIWLVVLLRRFTEDLFVQDSSSEIGYDVLSRPATEV